MQLFQCRDGDIVRWEEGGEPFCIVDKITDQMGFLYSVQIKLLLGGTQRYDKRSNQKYYANIINLTKDGISTKEQWEKQASDTRRQYDEQTKNTSKKKMDISGEQVDQYQIKTIKMRLSDVKDLIQKDYKVISKVLTMFLLDPAYSRATIYQAEKEWKRDNKMEEKESFNESNDISSKKYIYNIAQLQNPAVSLDRNISGEYEDWLNIFAIKLNAAIEAGNSVSPYIDDKAAKVYASICRKCTCSFEVMVLVRALPSGKNIPTVEEKYFSESLSYMEYDHEK